MNELQQIYQQFIKPLTLITHTDYTQGKDTIQTQHINKEKLKTLQRQSQMLMTFINWAQTRKKQIEFIFASACGHKNKNQHPENNTSILQDDKSKAP